MDTITIVRLILFILAGMCIIFALIYLLRAYGSRTAINKEHYGVGKLEARRRIQLEGYKGLALFVLSLALLGGSWLLAPRPVEESLAEQGATTIPDGLIELPVASPTPEPTAEPTPGIEPTEVEFLPTIELASPTPPPTVTSEPTPELQVAIVSSPVVGLNLRSIPNGELVERLEDQTVVTILSDETRIVEEIEWILVSAPSGNQGWVALSFLLFEQPTPTPPIVEEEATATVDGEEGASDEVTPEPEEAPPADSDA